MRKLSLSCTMLAALGVTRFTVYNYLDAIKERRKATAMAGAPAQ